MEQQFGQDGIAGTVSIRVNPSGRPVPSGFAQAHEYAIFCKAGAEAFLGKLPRTDAQMQRYRESDKDGPFMWELFRKRGSNSERRDRPSLYYPIYFDGSAVRVPDMTWNGQQREWVAHEPPKPEETKLFPVDESGVLRTWRWSPDAIRDQPENFCVKERSGALVVYYKFRPKHDGVLPLTFWGDSKYSATEHGTGTIKALFPDYNVFSYPKSIYAVEDCIHIAGLHRNNAAIMDFFAGSGTTGHAVVNLNRREGGRRRFTLIEMASYIDSVLIPRMKKVAYSPEWRDGKPKRMATAEEAERSPRIMKVLRLESYEDACDNIFIQRTKKQQEAFGKLPDAEREKYRLHYMLDIESRGSASLLNLDQFNRPFEYTLRVTRDDVTRDQTVDLVETFNWLLGLKVETIRLSKDKTFKPDEHGILEVTGEDPEGNRCLIVWRNTDEVDDDKLIAWFKKNRYSVKDFEWQRIYVNGDSTLENLKREDETWTVRLIEQEFHRLMFEGTE